MENALIVISMVIEQMNVDLEIIIISTHPPVNVQNATKLVTTLKIAE